MARFVLTSYLRNPQLRICDKSVFSFLFFEIHTSSASTTEKSAKNLRPCGGSFGYLSRMQLFCWSGNHFKSGINVLKDRDGSEPSEVRWIFWMVHLEALILWWRTKGWSRNDLWDGIWCHLCAAQVADAGFRQARKSPEKAFNNFGRTEEPTLRMFFQMSSRILTLIQPRSFSSHVDAKGKELWECKVSYLEL